MSRRILCYGDSNTYGYDPRSCLGGRYAKSVRWTALLNAEGWEIINDGENGRSIPRRDQEIKAVIQTVRQADPNFLVIMLGTNDLLQRPGLAAEICSERMERFLAALLAEIPDGLNVLLAAPPPMKAGAWVPTPEMVNESQRLANCYESLARRLNIHFANTGKWGVELAYDGVHFSEAGHRAFAEGMLRVMRALNEELPGVSKI